MTHQTKPDPNLAIHAELYHEAMECYRDMQQPHGRCLPREDRACAHCYAKDRLDQMLKGYKGRRVILA
jgi:hypothetical protein